MFKTILAAFLLFLVAQSEVVAQNALSLSFGFPNSNWDYSGNLDGLRTVNMGGWSITASGLKIKENGLVYGIDLGVNRYTNGFQYDRMRSGLKGTHNFSVVPFAGYRYSAEGTKFSVQTNLGFGLGIVAIGNKYYENDKTFQIQRLEGKDADGNLYSRPRYDLTFSGSQEVKSRVFPLLKPSLELHYAVGERSTLFAKGTLGISLMQDVIVRDFQKVVLESEEYHVTHSTSMSYWALELGYSLKLKK